MLPDRKAATLAAWLREHPEVEVVCRDGSAAYAEAIRAGAPHAVQVSDRWHLWHNLAKAVEKTVIAHSRCWHDSPARPDRPLDERTRERHTAVHTLLNQGIGLLQCARRLGWALNTVKRYARATTAEDLQRPPRYRETLVDPFRAHLPRRRAQDPQVPVTPAAGRDPRTGLCRQRQPSGALPQPGPRRRGMCPAVTAPPGLLAHDQARDGFLRVHASLIVVRRGSLVSLLPRPSAGGFSLMCGPAGSCTGPRCGLIGACRCSMKACPRCPAEGFSCSRRGRRHGRDRGRRA
ncbi:transposase [Micromonospora sp. NBC_00858]|uniref:transposase n=1 Tax=Micromonospora sp. NBC_00858 TaxID=2975979 RepID=UPI003865CF0D